MTAQQAYRKDCEKRPLYHDGTPRKRWEELSPEVKRTWVKNPTPRNL